MVLLPLSFSSLPQHDWRENGCVEPVLFWIWVYCTSKNRALSFWWFRCIKSSASLGSPTTTATISSDEIACTIAKFSIRRNIDCSSSSRTSSRSTVTWLFWSDSSIDKRTYTDWDELRTFVLWSKFVFITHSTTTIRQTCNAANCMSVLFEDLIVIDFFFLDCSVSRHCHAQSCVCVCVCDRHENWRWDSLICFVLFQRFWKNFKLAHWMERWWFLVAFCFGRLFSSPGARGTLRNLKIVGQRTYEKTLRFVPRFMTHETICFSFIFPSNWPSWFGFGWRAANRNCF